MLAQLPSITSPDSLLTASGEFFLECFAGHSAFTLAVVMAFVPALRPWELSHGSQFDVVAGLPVLLAAINCGLIVALHLGNPCQSFTQARVPALRSRLCPLGLPGLTAVQRALVISGNELASVSAILCLAIHKAGGYVSMESPERSLIWFFPEIRDLFQLPGFATVLCETACGFSGLSRQ